MAKFDAACAVDGYSVTVVDPAVAAHERAHGIEHVTPDMYTPAYSQAASLTPERLSAVLQGGGEFCAGLQLNPALGTFLLERISALGQQTAQLSDDQRTSWFHAETARSVEAFGGEEAFQAALTRVEGFLNRLPLTNFLAASLPKSVVIRDAWILKTLSNQALNIQAYEKGLKK